MAINKELQKLASSKSVRKKKLYPTYKHIYVKKVTYCY